MRIPPYLQRNCYGIYCFRRAVPAHLRKAISKREIMCSLRTREPRQAIQLARIVAIQVDQAFQEARMGKTKRTELKFELEFADGTKTKKEVTPQDISAMKAAGSLLHTNQKHVRHRQKWPIGIWSIYR